MRAASSVVTFGIFALGSAVLASACGSRGPLDDYSDLDASTAADVAAGDVVVADAVDATSSVDAGREAAPSPIDCGICLFTQCSQNIIGCVTNPSCQKAFQCVITECAGLGGGGGGGGGGGAGADSIAGGGGAGGGA
jgi:hypothetical protein